MLTALGVLPVVADSAGIERADRTSRSTLSPVELEHATIVAAVKQTPQEIRSGRLGH